MEFGFAENLYDVFWPLDILSFIHGSIVSIIWHSQIAMSFIICSSSKARNLTYSAPAASCSSWQATTNS